jgi:hypothetical protein
MQKSAKRLMLNRETVRSLQNDELRRVAGGRPDGPVYAKRMYVVTAGPCTQCVCHSTSTTTAEPLE